MTWTEERKQQLARLWQDAGKSAAEIAKEIGGLSRNAVLGQVHRMKLPKRGNEVAAANHLAAMKARQNPMPPKTTAAPKPAKPKPVAKALVQPKPKIEPICQPLGLPLEQLGVFQCRFAITGDVAPEHHLFCGVRTPIGSSWCAHHRMIVFQGRVSLQEAA